MRLSVAGQSIPGLLLVSSLAHAAGSAPGNGLSGDAFVIQRQFTTGP